MTEINGRILPFLWLVSFLFYKGKGYCMAFINNSELQPVTEISSSIQQACDDYINYLKFILQPTKKDIQSKISENKVSLHQVFSANLILAHSVDYLLAIRVAAGIPKDRGALVRSFDEMFSIDGAYLSNKKMELIDAINNALKHIRIDQNRYKSLGERYGQISFQSLVEDEGRVMCHLENYRFDYCRVVLLPALKALTSWDFEEAEDVLLFAKGEMIVEAWHISDTYDPDDPSTALDRMIEICTSPCKNCEEEAEECRCSEYVFAGDKGQFKPLYAASKGEFEELMGQISPSYSRT
ncbi:hypothetical protein [Janthinobacterium sp. BJB401]|uniref:hypothetical protein n=1 Tax=Janthinobacterium sp. BJB401 TaxID=2745934 RepID=UPI001C3C4614|nr:hypothetical protein [Janthinobacterium sp. BJB401]